MALSDLAVFTEYTYLTLSEGLDQQIELFNAASRNSFILTSGSTLGSYQESAFWKNISGLVRRRDAYGSGAITSKVLEHLVSRGVKVASGTPEVELDPGQFRWIKQNPETAGAALGQQLIGATLQDILNTAILMCSTALTNDAASVNYDGTAATASAANLARAAAKFGDRASDILLWVLHSKVLHDIYQESLANASRLFSYETVAVTQDGFGRLFVQTDSPNLVEADGVSAGVDKYTSLGLTQGAVVAQRNDDYDDTTVDATGSENIKRTFQAEWSTTIAIKGYSWDTASGGESPSDAALASAANYNRYATSPKDLAGVYLTSR